MLPVLPVNLGLSPITLPDIPSIASIDASNASSLSQPGQVFDDFGTLITNAINAINSTQSEADNAVTSLVTGQSTDIHSAMIAMEKANVTFNLGVQVRNRLMEAYTEIMRMPV
jgi:flagellar hook-basal body complex protein FliE